MEIALPESQNTSNVSKIELHFDIAILKYKILRLNSLRQFKEKTVHGSSFQMSKIKTAIISLFMDRFDCNLKL